MLKRLRILVRNLFGFSQSETNGFLVLCILFLGVVIIPFFIQYYLIPEPSQVMTTDDKQELDSMLAFLERQKMNASSDKNAKGSEKSSTAQLALKTFDPNTITLHALLEMNFPEWLAERLINYRTKVTSFQKKEDLKKLYGLSESLYKEIAPFVIIETAPTKRETSVYESDKKEFDNKDFFRKPRERLKPFDLNRADSLTLQKIYGIGPAYAKRIIKYRDLLGGYVALEQLQEVYGLKEPVVDSLKKYCFITAKGSIEKLNVNEADTKALAKHPYISYNLAKVIVSYRKQHGSLKQLDDLKKIKLIDENLFIKISPYLTL